MKATQPRSNTNAVRRICSGDGKSDIIDLLPLSGKQPEPEGLVVRAVVAVHLLKLNPLPIPPAVGPSAVPTL